MSANYLRIPPIEVYEPDPAGRETMLNAYRRIMRHNRKLSDVPSGSGSRSTVVGKLHSAIAPEASTERMRVFLYFARWALDKSNRYQKVQSYISDVRSLFRFSDELMVTPWELTESHLYDLIDSMHARGLREKTISTRLDRLKVICRAADVEGAVEQPAVRASLNAIIDRWEADRVMAREKSREIRPVGRLTGAPINIVDIAESWLRDPQPMSDDRRDVEKQLARFLVGKCAVLTASELAASRYDLIGLRVDDFYDGGEPTLRLPPARGRIERELPISQVLARHLRLLAGSILSEQRTAPDEGRPFLFQTPTQHRRKNIWQGSAIGYSTFPSLVKGTVLRVGEGLIREGRTITQEQLYAFVKDVTLESFVDGLFFDMYLYGISKFAVAAMIGAESPGEVGAYYNKLSERGYSFGSAAGAA